MRFAPRGGDQIHAVAEQALGVGEHALVVADAELVVPGCGSRHAAEDPVPLGVQVRAADHGGDGSRTQRQRCELVEVLLAGDSRALQASDSDFLHSRHVFARDDERVVDLSRVDHAGRDGHSVHEAQASVGDVEVHGRGAEADAVVNRYCDGRLKRLARDGGIDQQTDLVSCDSRLRQSVASRGGGPLDVIRRILPVAPRRHSGHALKEPLRKAQFPERVAESLVEGSRTHLDGSDRLSEPEERDVRMPSGGVAVRDGQIGRANGGGRIGFHFEQA